MASQTGTSTSQVLVTVLANGVICAVFVTCFIVLRLKFTRIYSPKTMLKSIPEQDRPQPLPKDPFLWLWVILTEPPQTLIKQCGLDGYFFLRYLWIMGCCFTGGILTWIVLLPVNATNGNHKKGFDQLSISNVNQGSRYYAHVLISWIFYGLVIFTLERELYYYNSLRTAALALPHYAAKRSSRTVLFRFVPDEMLDTKLMYKLFDGIKRIYISRTTRKLDSLIIKRQNMVMALERAENKLLKLAMKQKLKAEKKGETITPVDDISAYVPEKKRPRINIGGKIFKRHKVDAITHYIEEIPKLNKEIAHLQRNYHKKRPKNSLIVEFETQEYAQLAYQLVISHTPGQFVGAEIGFEPGEVVWNNLRIFSFEQSARTILASAAMIALIVLWAIPTGFVGSIASIDTLLKTFKWLSFIKRLPGWLQGVVSGLLPTFLLAILMFMLPIFIRTAAQVRGATTKQRIEDFTQKVYMVFQVVNGFLVAALMSSVTAAVKKIIDHPEEAMHMLAAQLPLSSNFYISYLALNAFTIAGGTLFQIVNLILFYVLGSTLDKTVRQKWTRYVSLDSMAWGTTFPTYTLLVVITLTYAIISPIILIFGAFTMFMVYIAYCHNLVYCLGFAPDGRGMYYRNAVSETMIGIYLGQICILGIAVFGKGWGAIVLAVIGLVVTILWHLHLNKTYHHQLKYVSMDAMRPLDGITDTPSAKGPTEYVAKVVNKSRGHASKTNLLLEHQENKDLKQELQEDVGNQATQIVPLLADRDFKEIGFYNPLVRYFRFDIFANFRHAKTDLPPDYYDDPAPEADDRHAYDSPLALAKCPGVWIPRDPMGLSDIEVARLATAVEASNKNAAFNEKGEIYFTGPNPL